MRKEFILRLLLVYFVLLLSMAAAQAVAAHSSQDAVSVRPTAALRVCAPCIRAHEEFLASDAMQGRGSGTHDELVAATYIASELRQYGIEPAGDNGGYIQSVPTIQRKITSAPQLTILPASGDAITWTYGKEFMVKFLTQTEFSGPLRKLDTDKASNRREPKVEPGAVVFITGSDENKQTRAVLSAASEGATAV